MIEHQNLENWLLLPRVSLGEANRLFIEIKFTMRRCQDIPLARSTCKETLKVYAFPTATESDFPTTNWHSDERWFVAKHNCELIILSLGNMWKQ
jgi:hypothetical protein